MQQAIYNNTSSVSIQANTACVSTPKTSSLLRWVARKWDLVGVVALMGSSAAYGAFALAHVGL